MTDTVPDAAVQIMKRRLVSAPDLVEAMATDLHDAGLLHDPAEVRRLRELLSGAINRRDELEAEVTALRAELAAADEAEAERKVECPAPLCAASFVSRVPFQAERRLILHYGQVHAALPSATHRGGMMDEQEIPLHPVTFWACDLCITGAGGECHVPGCMYWCKDAPRGVDLEWLRAHALPPVDAPAPPQGEDAEWAARRHAGFQAAIADTDARIAEAAAVPAGPQPADETGGRER